MITLPAGYDSGKDVRVCKASAEVYLADMRKFIDATLDYSSMSSAHFIVSGHWQRTTPAACQTLLDRYVDVESLISDCTHVASGRPLLAHWPAALNDILRRARALSLPRCTALRDATPAEDGDPVQALLARQVEPALLKLMRHLGACDQKGYEVALLAAKIADVARARGITRIVDLGAGQGYLSAILAFYYGFDVIGVDADEVQTRGANKKFKSVARWQKAKAASTHLNYVTRYINKAKDFFDLWEAVGRPLQPGEKWLLCGLHTCGDLTPSILHHFVHSQTDSVVNVGCCYNLIESSFPSSRIGAAYFPTMEHAQRMLATQAPWRWQVSKEQNAASLRKHFYRACLQALLVKKGIVEAADSATLRPELQTGKLRPHAFQKGFYHYAQLAIKKMTLPMPLDFTEAECNALYEEAIAQGHEKALVLSVLMRACIGPVLESVILVDRWLYLVQAQEIIDPSLTGIACLPVFDPIASPRNMLYVAHRGDAPKEAAHSIQEDDKEEKEN